MTASELMRLLQDQDPDKPVCLSLHYGTEMLVSYGIKMKSMPDEVMLSGRTSPFTELLEAKQDWLEGEDD